MIQRPVAESCFRNQAPILEALHPLLSGAHKRVLELGSGTGQHAVFLARHLPDTCWQPSDILACLPGIQAWCDYEKLANVRAPLELDVDKQDLQSDFLGEFDVVFTANTLHFVSESTASNFVRMAAMALASGGLFVVYGPFNDAGRFTSEGNGRLQEWLLARDAESGIKDQQWLLAKAQAEGMALLHTASLPANNLLFVFVLEA